MRKIQQIGLIMLAILLPGLFWPLIGQAGGWPVITLEELPQSVVAGQPVEISFMVRQHGWTPAAWYIPEVTAVHAETEQAITATAQSAEREGRYAAILTLPQAGTWRWSIDLGYGIDQPMPPLRVEKAEVEVQQVASPWSMPFSMGLVGFVGAVGALVVWWRKPNRWLLGLVGIMLVMSMTGFALALPVTPQAEAKKPLDESTQIEIGAALFVAKGCTVCHRHEAIERTGGFYSNIGPNLTNMSLTPVYLQLWLKDPPAVKPNTKMPNLDLSDTEIEALISFLTNTEASTSKP